MARTSSSPRTRPVAWALTLFLAAAIGASLLAQPGAPNIQVLDGTTDVPAGSTVAFGSTPVGVAATKTFTVKNTGTENLLVSEAVAVPVGFTVMATFPGVPNALLPGNVPAFTIAPGASATFKIALNSAAAGDFSGNVSLATNVTGKNPFVFKVTGTATGSSGGGGTAAGLSYRDDSDAAFTFTPGWVQNYYEVGASGRVPFQQALTWANPGTGTETATWTFTGLEPGQYKVSATWIGYGWGATNTPFTVLDGTKPLGTVRVNQQVDSAGFNDGNSLWQDLGTFTITSTTLAVRMSDDANSYPNADGVRIIRVGGVGETIDDAGPGFSVPSGTWNPGYSEFGSKDFQRRTTWADPTPTPGTPTATARWTFTVTPGTYRVLAGFHGYSWGATNAPYSVFDNGTNLTPSPIRVNQQVTPGDLMEAGTGWKNLGFFKVGGTKLIVQLSNDCNSWPSADAVRIEGVNGGSAPSGPDTVRLLEQATWGPTPGLITQVQATGYSAWLNQQFVVPATSYPTLPLYKTNNNATDDNKTSCFGDPNVAGNPARTACLRDHYSMYPLQTRFFTNALYGEDQLRQRVAWSLHRIWVVSGVDLVQPAWVAPYLQILSNNAFGNYRTLMSQVTLNPAMGNYLDMAGSTKANPNENYPRELLQLFTTGLVELNPDGTQKLDGGGNPIPVFDQDKINNFTKVFTGWAFAPAPAAGIPNYIDPMRLGGAATENPTNHFFVPAGQTLPLLRGFALPSRTATVANAYLDLNNALDNIYDHPSVAPFISRQLIQGLVTSNPSPAYIARVTDTFNRNRTNPSQLREVVRAILLDPEARGDLKSASNYGRLKEPVLFLTNLMRLFDAKSADRTVNSDGYLNPDAVNMGQDTFRPPSVFSYYSPFKVIVSGSPPVFGPEFQLLTTSTALRRANFVNQCFQPNSTRTIDVVRAKGTTPSGVDPATGLPLVPTGPLGTAVDVTWLLPYVDPAKGGSPTKLVDELDRLMLHNTMTAEMKSAIVTAVNAVASTNLIKRVRTAVYLVASSSQYQVQR